MPFPTSFPGGLDNFVDGVDVIHADAINAIENILVGPQLFNVRGSAYGAKGDGVTNDGPAINLAITAAFNAGGGIVLIPPSALGYAISTTLIPKNEVTVLGGGPDATILKWTGSTNSFMISNGTGYTTVLSKFCLAEMTLDANNVSGTVPLGLFASQKGHYRDLQIQNVAGAGTYAIRLEALSVIGQPGPLYDNGVLNDFKNVTIINAVRGINITGTPAAAACTLNHFYDLAMYQIHDIGLRFGQTCDTNYFYGVVIIVDSNNATGLSINNGANRAIDNDAKLYSFYGMAMSADPPGKTGFTCFDLGWTTAVEVYNFYSDPSLTTPTLVGGPSAPKGLVIYDTSQYPMIVRMWDTQIVPKGKHAYGHTYQSIAWANPLSIDASVGQFVNVTGTVTSSFTINAPTNPLLGQILDIKLTKANDFNTYIITWNAVFNGAPQLGTDANIIQHFAWWYDGTNWQQLGGPLDQVGAAWFGAKLTANSIVSVTTLQAFGAITAAKDFRRSRQAPAFAASLTIDASQGEIVSIGALTANITINAPTNPATGQFLELVFTQDGTGGRTATWNAAFKTAWQPAPAPSAISSISFAYDGTNWQQVAATDVTVQSQASPANPTGTTSTTGVMMGLAGAITPQRTGRVLVMCSGDIFNVTAIADGGKVQLRYGTGTAPVNAAALTGTTIGGLVQYVTATTAEKAPFALQAILTGAAINTALWLDVGLAAITGGTATIENISLTAVEI